MCKHNFFFCLFKVEQVLAAFITINYECVTCECMFTTFGVCVFVFDGILPSKLSPPPQGKLFKHTHSVCDVVDFAVTHVFQCVCLCVIFSTFSFSVHNWCTTMMLKFFSAHFHFFNQNILWRPLWRQNRGFRKMFTSLIFLSLTVQSRK